MVNGCIKIRGLRVATRVGVTPEERARPQTVVLDVDVDADLAPAAASDDLADTLNYGELAQRVAAIVGGPPANLIETVAGRVADAVLADARVRAVEVTLHKPQAPIPLDFTDVGVVVHRGRPAGPPGPRIVPA